MMLYTRRTPRAFTLIEATIAIVIVTLGSISTFSLMMFTRLHNEEEQERARAHQIASAYMERVKAELFSATAGFEDVQLWDNGTPEDPSDDTACNVAVTLRDSDGHMLVVFPPQAERVQVEVTVSWHPRGRRSDETLQESLMSFIVPKG
jgi:type II secretory pathway pseudopilin PulG